MARSKSKRERTPADGRPDAKQLLDAVISAFPGAIARIGRDWRYEYVSPAYERIFGLPASEIVGRHVRDLVGAAAFAKAEPHAREAFGGKRVSYDNVVPTPQGMMAGTMTLIPECSAAGEVTSILAIGVGPSDQARVEQALAASETRTRVLVNAAKVGLWDWDLVTNAVYFSPEWKHELGYGDGELPNRFEEWERRIHPDDLEPTMQSVREFIAGKVDEYDVEFRMQHRDGSWRWFLARADLLRDAQGTPVRMVGCNIDVTERRRAEARLREQEERLRLFVEHSPAAIAMLDRDMVYVVASRRWSINYRLGDQPLAGRSHYEVFPEIPQRWRDVHQRCLAGAVERHEQDPFLRADGTTDWIRWEVRPWRLADGSIGGIIMLTEVITDRLVSQRVLEQANDRLHALSRRLLEIQEAERRAVGAELHDELGQLLTAARMDLQLVERVPDAAVRRAQLDQAVASLDRALQQVRSLSLELRPPMLDHFGVVAALQWLVERHVREGMSVTWSCDHQDARYDPAVETACFRIAQEALTNVARHAAARHVTVDLRETQGTLHLRVRDDGRGFDVAAAREHAVARGSSLGLFGMEERARLAGGGIEWTSTPHQGTEIRAWFACDATARPGDEA